MARQGASAALAYPTSFQIALAIAILRTKPAGTTAREFVSQLRSSISECPAPAPYATDAYIDGVTYWQTRYEQVKDERAAMLAENVELMRQIDDLYARSADPGRAPTDRKKDDIVDLMPSLTKLTAKAADNGQAQAALSPSAASAAVNRDLDALSSMPEGAEIARQLYHVHKLIRNGIYMDATSLPPRLIGLAQALTGLLKRVHDLNYGPSQLGILKSPPALEGLFLPLTRSYSSLLFGIKCLQEAVSETERRDRRAVVYTVVQSFTAILDIISEQCIQIVLKTPHTGGLGIDDNQPASENQPNKAQQLGSRSSVAMLETPGILAELLLALMDPDILSPSDALHCNIFEGLALLVLQRSAVLVSIFVLGRQTDDAGIDVPATRQGISAEVELRAFELEASRLGDLVERVSTLAPLYLSSSHTRTYNRSKTTTAMRPTEPAQDGNEADTYQIIRNRLQTTFKQCMFGGSEAQGKELTQCLSLPVQVDAAELGQYGHRMDLVEQSSAERLTEQTWNLIGWDLLSREEDW